MTPFALTTAIISLVLFAGFVTLSVWRFGWRKSYSSYAAKWIEFVPMHNINVWSVVTVVVAFLILPSMLERGEGNLVQCLGFFVPLYLAVVAFTPRYETEHSQYVVHVIGTIVCAAIAVAWLIFVRHLWWVLLIALAVFGAVAYLTKTYKTSYVFWLEMAMFASVYAAVLFGR